MGLNILSLVVTGVASAVSDKRDEISMKEEVSKQVKEELANRLAES